MWPLVNSRNRSVYKGIKKIIWYREKMKNRVWKDTCIPGFITALFITGKIWKQPKCPSTDERIKTTRRWALCVYVCVFVDGVQSVMSDSLQPHGLYSPPASSVHGISQARILEWVTISFSRGSSQPRDRTCVSCIFYVSRWILYNCTTWEALIIILTPNNTWHCSNFPFFPWN